MFSLRQYRSSLKGLADLLPWAAMIDDGIILNKNGSFTTGYFFRGKDLSSATPQELDAVAVQVNDALCKLGTGWMIHVDTIRTPADSYPAADTCHFSDSVTQLIDEERRAQATEAGARFDSIYALAITYMLPTEAANRVSAWFIIDDSKERRSTINYSDITRLFKMQVLDLADGLGSALNLRPMSSNDLLTYLHCCVTGLDHRVSLPPIPMYLDALLASADFYGGLAPRVGGMHLRPITIMGYPQQSMPGILDKLNHLPFPYRWSTRFIAMDPSDAGKRLKDYRLGWWKKRVGVMGLIKSTAGNGDATWQNNDAVAQALDADEAITENDQGLVRYGMYSTTILVMDEDMGRADANAREVVKLLRNSGFPARVEDMNAVEAYLGSLPGDGYANIRKPCINTLNLSHLLPLTAVWAGHSEHPAPADMYPAGSPPLMIAATTGATPLRVSLHVGDLGHFKILGPPGAGKSTLLALLIASHFRYRNAQVFGFDFGYSMSTLCEAAGGAHYDIGAEGAEFAFCPLSQLETKADIAWAAQYVELLVTLRLPAGQMLTVGQQNKIAEAIANMAADTTSSRDRTITHIRSSIQDDDIKDALKYYTHDGPLGHLLDAETDCLTGASGKFFVFETSHLLALGDRAVVPVLMHVFRQIEKRVSKSIPTLIPADEVWKTFFSHPLATARLREWLKTMRKENCAFGFATQNLSDILDSSIASVIIDNTATTFYLPNPEATTQNLAPIYRSFGLNDTEIRNLAFARPKRDYYLSNADGRRMFQLGLGPVALAFVGSSGKEQAQLVRHLKQQHGTDWVYHWLLARNAPIEWADFWRTLAIPAVSQPDAALELTP